MTDYHEWAVNLLEELYYVPQDQRIQLLEENLMMAGQSDDEWWRQQDEDIEHIKEMYKKRRWY